MDFSESGMLGKILEAEEARTYMGKNCPMPQGEFPAETPLAMAYVAFQSWEKPYDSDAGLSRGTVFPSLDKPFIGEEAVRRGND
ncbi:MAG: spore coat associated protein CotJA [Oscillospiraceae bacterium]